MEGQRKESFDPTTLNVDSASSTEASVSPCDADHADQSDSDSSDKLLFKLSLTSLTLTRSKKRRQRKQKNPHKRDVDEDKKGPTPEATDSDKTVEPRDPDKTPEPSDPDKTPELSDPDKTPEPFDLDASQEPPNDTVNTSADTEMELKPDISSLPDNLPFKFGVYAQEKNGRPIYGCQINTFLKPEDPIIFATTGGNRVSIYECDKYNNKPTDKGGLGIKLIKVFADPEDEEFYTCAWSMTREGKPLLAAAGARSVIRVFSLADNSIIDIIGHTGAINQLAVHPDDPNLLMSASKDRSVRMWNIANGRCVAVFFGDGGHRDQVITVDINLEGKLMVTGGMDHSLIVWKLKSKEVVKSILDSYNPKKRNLPALVQVPIYSTRSVHRNYIDCALWFGSFIFSKSIENEVICWKGGELDRPWNSVQSKDMRVKIVTLEVEECEVWFVRFGLDCSRKWLALGNQEGKIYLFNVGAEDPTLIQSVILSHKKCTATIRQTCFSRDGKILLAVCDDGTIWRWDLAD